MIDTRETKPHAFQALFSLALVIVLFCSPRLAAADEDGAEIQAAWASFQAAGEMVRSTGQNLAQSQAVREVAASIVGALRADVAASSGMNADADTPTEVPVQLQLAEMQLAVADKQLESARVSAGFARSLFDAARDNLLRLRSGTPPGGSDADVPIEGLRLTGGRFEARDRAREGRFAARYITPRVTNETDRPNRA